ncbi:hypothetical protein KW783_03820 [Candidatus Parcubacteria bacterium]|nr:hypothetical protein [Candidatus Parcubacteria bacterium]
MSTIETLEKIFGTAAKVKVMRLFLFNPHSPFDVGMVSKRTHISRAHARKEIAGLEKAGMIKRKPFVKDLQRKRGKKIILFKKRSSGWALNDKFHYLIPLQNFLVHLSPLKYDEIARKLDKVGRIKLIIVSGLFIQDWDSRVDLLVVGDGLRKGSVDNVIKVIESEIGKELKYAAFETTDFKYRLTMFDKLIRDILDFPHKKVVDKIGVA